MDFFDAFSGIGGFHLGIKRAHPDWKCLGFSEIEPHAIETYKRHFPEVENYGDITKMDRLPEGTELFCGGFPCQAFSFAGKRLGLADTRGTLFYEIARLASVSKPKILFLENVQGLLYHDNGRTFATVLSTFSELGYNLEWQVLNSRYFGTPQNRSRIFIIGHLGTEPFKRVFPIAENGKEAEGIYQKIEFENEFDNPRFAIYNARMMVERTCPSICLRGYTGKKKTMALCPTLLASSERGIILQTDEGLRYMTPTEAERAQTFPDGWVTEGKQKLRYQYKQLGNSVCVNVIEEIARRLG